MSDDRTQQESSMEDILASIRQILSEDENETERSEESRPPVFSAEAEPEEDILELTDTMMVASGKEVETEIDRGGVEAGFSDRPLSQPGRQPESVAMPRPATEDECLLSPPVSAMSSSALSEYVEALTRDRETASPAGVTLEDFVRSMLKPILKEWLDANLPQIVERIVRKEIARLSERVDLS